MLSGFDFPFSTAPSMPFPSSKRILRTNGDVGAQRVHLLASLKIISSVRISANISTGGFPCANRSGRIIGPQKQVGPPFNAHQ